MVFNWKFSMGQLKIQKFRLKNIDWSEVSFSNIRKVKAFLKRIRARLLVVIPKRQIVDYRWKSLFCKDKTIQLFKNYEVKLIFIRISIQCCFFKKLTSNWFSRNFNFFVGYSDPSIYDAYNKQPKQGSSIPKWSNHNVVQVALVICSLFATHNVPF